MSIPYETTGRTEQKARTRDALIAATRRLLAAGTTPTVEQAAAEAKVSRAAAYRYFPSQGHLLAATHPEIEQDSLLGANPPNDAVSRLDIVARRIVRMLLQNEYELRAMLRLALEAPEPRRDQLLRRGRRITWIDDALAPLRQSLSPKEYSDLLMSVCASLGIEPLVWLVDMAGVERRRAGQILRRTALTLVQSAVADQRAAAPSARKTPRRPRLEQSDGA